METELGGKTLVGGIYKAAAELGLTGTLTLDGGRSDGLPSNQVFTFQAGTTLITEVNSKVALTGGAQACNIFWQVGSAATFTTGTGIGTDTDGTDTDSDTDGGDGTGGTDADATDATGGDTSSGSTTDGSDTIAGSDGGDGITTANPDLADTGGSSPWIVLAGATSLNAGTAINRRQRYRPTPSL